MPQPNTIGGGIGGDTQLSPKRPAPLCVTLDSLEAEIGVLGTMTDDLCRILVPVLAAAPPSEVTKDTVAVENGGSSPTCGRIAEYTRLIAQSRRALQALLRDLET